MSTSLTDPVDEASAESFPCSDPPSFTTLRAGPPASEPIAVRPRPRVTLGARLRRAVRAPGVLAWFVAGLGVAFLFGQASRMYSRRASA